MLAWTDVWGSLSCDVTPVTSLSTDDLVRQQQKQIEDLKLQLASTQQQLSAADRQAQLHQEQLRKLALAKIATLSQQNALNALLAEQARTQRQIQALAQAHNAQLSQLTQQSLEIAGQSNASTAPKATPTATPIIVATTNGLLSGGDGSAGGAVVRAQQLTSLLQAQGLQNVKLSGSKLVQVINASGQPQLVLTSQPGSNRTAAPPAVATSSPPQALLITKSVLLSVSQRSKSMSNRWIHMYA